MKLKKIILILSLLFIVAFVAFVNNEVQDVGASEFSVGVNVSTESEFISALSKSSSNSHIFITLTENIELNQKVELNGNIYIKAAERKEIKLLSNAYIDLRNGVKATFTNIDMVKDKNNTEKQMILFRDNSKQGYVNFYNCNLTSLEDANSIVLNSISINGRFYLDNTNVSGSDISCANGSIYLSGNTTITNVNTDVLVYDFRECIVIATPGTNEFTTKDKVSLSISQKPVFYKGNKEDVQKFNVDIYYTLDGSDPVTSSTKILYTKDNPISLVIDREIKATVVGEGICYSIGVNEFEYDVNEDKTPSEIISVTECESLSVRCLTELDIKDFPEAVEITLADGRNIYAIAKWDLSPIDIEKEGIYDVYATLNAPYFVSNQNGLKAKMEVCVYYHEIEDFTFTENNPMQVGKNTNEKDYVVGEFNALGGDEKNYTYTLISDDKTYDNDKFYIENNLLKLKSKLAAGSYEVKVEVQSADKTASIVLNLEVLDMAYEKIVVLNPYDGINWESVNFVSSALHNHTWFSNKEFEETEHNDSAFDTADERIAAYKALGFGAVIITEHDYVTLDYYNGQFTDNEILTIYGNEMSKKYHTLFYGLEPYYDNRGMGINVTNGIEGNLKNIAEMNGNGIAYFAHPNRSTTNESYWYNLFEKYDVVYGMEVFNAGQAQKNYSENVWDYILTKSMPERAIWGSASDDAHSNGAIATGWQVMLLSDDEMNKDGLYNCLKNGNSFLTTICVNPLTDDEIMYDAVIGDIPYFTSVVVDEENSTITVTAEDYIKLEWVSANGDVVSTSPTLDLNATYGVDKYVRCRIYGTGGMSHTQPIGIADGENLYAGVENEDIDHKTPSIGDTDQSDKECETLTPDDENQENKEPIVDDNQPSNESSETTNEKGCSGSAIGTILGLVCLLSIAVFLKRKYNKSIN